MNLSNLKPEIPSLHTADATYGKYNDAPPKSATPSTAQSTVFELPNELSGRYEILRNIGSGTQGKVFQAKRLKDGCLVAIKILRIDSIHSWKEYTLFHREAEVLASLDIPGIAKFYEACDCLGHTPPCACIVQEFIEGTTLKQILHSGYRFSLAQVCELALQLIDILEKLHTHTPSVIHRDIKPSNIIIQQNNGTFKVFLIDFGAVANPQIQSGGSTIAGTYGYMSPEQHIGRSTPQSDTYALGALLAYMLSGVDPADMKTQNLRLIIDPYVENHPPALVQTLRRMLDPDLGNRLSDLSELRKRFLNFSHGDYFLENETYQPFDKKEFKSRLLSVKDLCAPQNLELWQNLSDLPENRPAFPIPLCTHPQFASYLVEDDTRLPIFQTFLFIVLILVIIMSFSCIFTESGLDRIIAIVGFILSSMLFIYYILHSHEHTLKRQRLFQRIHWDRPPIQKRHKIKKAPCPDHLNIYQHGRKTIATITKIEFIPDTVPPIKLDDDTTQYRSLPAQPRFENAPAFWIYYKFNPPDDDTAKDIIHCIQIHRDPQGLFKPGDPLPILYLLAARKPPNDHKLFVTQSMPYPFPLDDLERPTDYLGHCPNLNL